MKDRKDETRARWLETISKHRGDTDGPDSQEFWCRRLDTASRDEIISIQNDKLAVLTPFLYENSGFYRRRFDRLGLAPTDIRTVEDLPKWPVVDKTEMGEDAAKHPPFGTYQTIGEEEWRDRGWMLFQTSGSTGAPRPFRYTHVDRSYWEWTDARALYAMGIRNRDTVFPLVGFGPHVWMWGVVSALLRMGVGIIPGGGLDAQARARAIDRYRPTVVACTPSYALHLGRTMQRMGLDPSSSSVATLFVAGEPTPPGTRQHLRDLWASRVVEFYGCTEAAPNAGGFSCRYSTRGDEFRFTHLLEDVQIWELVDAERLAPVGAGEQGLTVCTSLCSESSPQLRFLVGDYTTFDEATCECGRSHLRALGGFRGRADDLINVRGVKFFPSQIEEAVRAVPGAGDEFEIVLRNNDDGLPVMIVRVEHAEHEAPAKVVERASGEIRTRCEVRAGVEVLPPDTLPKTQFKAKRVRDERES